MSLFPEVPVISLPDFILESENFKDWLLMFPDETLFIMPCEKVLNSLEIHTNQDVYDIIKIESLFLFSEKTRIEILRNIDLYWQNNHNASGLVLPEQDISYFGNQVKTLFDNHSSIVLKCMKKNYIELFEYIYERDGESCLTNHSVFDVYGLLYYAVINGNREILLRGIKYGCLVTFKLLEPAIYKGHTEILHILIDEIKKNNIEINMTTVYQIIRSGTRESFALLLDNFVTDINDFCFRKDNGRVIYSAMSNINIFKELVSRNIQCPDKIFAKGLIEHCVNQNKSIEMINLIGTHFGYTFADHYSEKYISKINPRIPEHVIKNDNIEMYNLLRSAGFLVTDELVNLANYYRCINLSPGLLKKHIAEDNRIMNP